jgi:DNA-binding NarL/FixJ family response regulator
MTRDSFTIARMTMFDRKEAIRARVLLADDHPEVVENLRALVEAEFEVVATVGDGNALVAAAEALAPDVIVTDVAMPGLNGITAAARILASNPAARIVFVTVHNSPVLVQKSLATGALGYVLKLTAGDDLVPAIRAALQGKRHLSPTICSSVRST